VSQKPNISAAGSQDVVIQLNRKYRAGGISSPPLKTFLSLLSVQNHLPTNRKSLLQQGGKIPFPYWYRVHPKKYEFAVAIYYRFGVTSS
jgi:hypothetical protein